MHSASGLQGCSCHPIGEASCHYSKPCCCWAFWQPNNSIGTVLFMPMATMTMLMIFLVRWQLWWQEP